MSSVQSTARTSLDACGANAEPSRLTGIVHESVVRGRLRIALVIAAGLALSREAAGQSKLAQCQPNVFPAPTLCERARLDTLHASYLLLVDESGSMRGRWPAVKAVLAEFVSAIADGDELEIRTFAGTVRTLIPPTPSSDPTRANWQSRLAGLPDPAGANTDLGLAAASVNEALRSAPTDRLYFVFLLTDGQHDPPAPVSASGFPSSWSPTWQKLSGEAQTLTSARPASISLLRLSEAADRSMLARVFPGLVVTDAIGPDALRAWFANARRDVSVSKLRLAIEQELKRPAWSIDAEELSVLSNRQSLFDVRVRPQRHVVTTQPATSTPVAMPGGGTIALVGPMPNDSTGTARVGISGPACGWWQRPGGCGTASPVYARLTTVLEPKDELRRIGIDPENHADSVFLNFRQARGGALPATLYYPLAAALALALGFLALMVKWAMHQPRLSGSLVYTPARSGSDSQNGESQTIRLGGIAGRSYSLRGPSGEEVVRFDARSERGKSRIYATACDSDVRVNGKVLAGAHRLDRTTRFETNHGDIRYYSTK